ncbi:MAG: DUF423 domain-containing protein [Leptospira sp.]|nr:DUF423 domain-containing protein [Leptospira sp.]
MNLVNNQKNLRFFFLFTVSSFFAVSIGAFGAHGLKTVLTFEMLQIFETGNKYQFYHSLAGILVSIFSFFLNASLSPYSTNTDSMQVKTIERSIKSFGKAQLFFSLGILVFSGSLYTLSITGIRILGAITPIGGLCFLVGWVFFSLGVYSLLVPKK